ncbi:MAG: methyltransferase domain-containing protein [Gemmatimonadaceae bacterium]|nr:methyltransferase domain-containing protein [Gemmatimonadaceae bacterium]
MTAAHTSEKDAHEHDQQVTAQYYDEYWSGTTGWSPPPGLDEDLRAWLDPLMVRGRKALDVGCGDGARYGARVHASGVEIHGVDISEVAVASARERGIDARVASLADPLPHPDASFDVVICLEVLEHLVNPAIVTREIARVLKPGGLALLSVPNSAFWTTRVELMFTGHFNPRGSPVTQRAFPWRDPHLRFFTFTSIEAMLAEGGLRTVKDGGLECQFLRIAVADKMLGRKSWIDKPITALGRMWPSLLARRCVVLATPAELAA